MTANPFQLQPLSPACGAEVTGMDLTRADDAAMQAVFAALAEHGVLFFRDQHF
jgi:alpha-ketoglutarate-dependent taurine dioxygenase